MSYDPQPGMRVVCIDDDWHTRSQYHPVRGKVYTIKSVEADPVVWGERYSGLYIGLYETGAWREGEPEYPALFFKPLDETRLDVFRQHLTKAPSPRERVGA